MLGVALRFIVSALVILFLGFLLPGFRVAGFWTALAAAILIALIGWGAEMLLGRDASPYGRGLLGFLASAAVIYGVQFVVGGMSVSLLGALLAALIIGVVDVFLPTELR